MDTHSWTEVHQRDEDGQPIYYTVFTSNSNPSLPPDCCVVDHRRIPGRVEGFRIIEWPRKEADARQPRLCAAAQCYVQRREGKEIPLGYSNKQGWWFPEQAESQYGCCQALTRPSRSRPLVLLRHCKTLRHIAEMYGVVETHLRRYVQAMNHKEKEGAPHERC